MRVTLSSSALASEASSKQERLINRARRWELRRSVVPSHRPLSARYSVTSTVNKRNNYPRSDKPYRFISARRSAPCRIGGPLATQRFVTEMAHAEAVDIPVATTFGDDFKAGSTRLIQPTAEARSNIMRPAVSGNICESKQNFGFPKQTSKDGLSRPPRPTPQAPPRAAKWPRNRGPWPARRPSGQAPQSRRNLPDRPPRAG